MLSQSRKAAILQKLAEWKYDPTPGYTKAMSAPPGTRTGYAQDNSVAPSVNAAGLGGRRDPAAMAAMRKPPAPSSGTWTPDSAGSGQQTANFQMGGNTVAGRSVRAQGQ
jgi:hypothetical protein